MARWKLDPIFNAKTAAVIGASDKPGSIGHVIMRNFMTEFTGKAYPVNPNHKTIMGKKSYKSVLDIHGKMDLAIIAVPAKAVPAVMKTCAKKKVRGAIIITGGFSEVGEDELENEVKRIADNAGIPIIGVNCLGVFDAHSQVDTLFLPNFKLDRPRAGVISFISQSGAVGSAVLDIAGSKGFGVSKFISYGNATNVDEVDLLEYLEKDKDTKVICLYIEGTKRGKEFIKVAKRVSKKKPIIGIKGGKTEEGSKAAASHTGALAGASAVWDAAFKQAGIIQANDVSSMFDFARVLAEQPLPKSNRVAVLTNGGGFGILATDALVGYGLTLAKLSKETVNAIRKVSPDYVVTHNPVDIIGDADVNRYKVALDALIIDKNVDSIIVIVLYQTAGVDSDIVDVVAEINEKGKKPIICISAGGDYTTLHMKLMEESGVPTFDSIKAAARSLAGLTNYAQFKKK